MKPRNVTIITPWYPTTHVPYGGAFVEAQAKAISPICDSISIYHAMVWTPRERAEELQKLEEIHFSNLPKSTRSVNCFDPPNNTTLTQYPVLIPPKRPFYEIAEKHAATLNAALGGEPLQGDIVHAHVGISAGYAAVRNTKASTPVFVTEHASFLQTMLDHSGGIDIYREVLAKCKRFYVVGSGLKRQLSKAIPEYSSKIDLIPNPIPFQQSRPEPVKELNRWICVGFLIPRKRVDHIIRAFAIAKTDNPKLTLDIVGTGICASDLRNLANKLKVNEAINFVGPLPPEKVRDAILNADLLIHASENETFGVTVIEGIEAGVPVIATRCGGPEETLAGVEEFAAELIDVTPHPEAIVDAYKRLVKRLPDTIDIEKARTILASRYSYNATADAYEKAWFSNEE